MKKNVNRRDFIKSSTVLGTATMGAGIISLSSGSPENVKNKTLSYVNPPKEIGVLQVLENKLMKVQVFTNGAIEVYDKVNNQQWKTYTVAIQDETRIQENILWGRRGRGMGEQYPGKFIGKKENGNLRFALYGNENVYIGSFSCKYELKNEWLGFELLEVGDELPSLVFPPPFESDALVLPTDGGRLIKNDSSSIYSGLYSRTQLQFFDRLSMRFIAGLNGENGWICAYDTTSVDAGAMHINSSVAPAWVRSMGKWQGHYKVFFSFTGNNYVGIAKRYRKFAKEKGFFKSLKEKIEKNPEAAKLLGGRAIQFMNYKSKGYPEAKQNYWATDKQVDVYKKDHFLFSFKDTLDIVKYFENEMGFNKGMVLLRGWMHGGYDSTHPDIWPIETNLGTVDELKEIMALRDKYVTALHDNYQDYYPTCPSFPKGVVVRDNGRLMTAGMWFGKQSYMTNSRDGAKFAARNWKDVKTLGSSGYFVDTTPCNPLHESYEEGNELTRVQDMQGKFDVLKVFYDAGQVVGSEAFGDFCVPVMHWTEHRYKRNKGKTIPMWQLIFHDTMFHCRYNVFDRSTPYPSWLEDMLYGNFLRFWVPENFKDKEPWICRNLAGWGNWEYTKEEFMNTYHVDKWHEKIGLSDMTTHKVFDENDEVEEVIYDDKHRIVVNFGSEPARVDGKMIKPYGYFTEG